MLLFLSSHVFTSEGMAASLLTGLPAPMETTPSFQTDAVRLPAHFMASEGTPVCRSLGNEPAYGCITASLSLEEGSDWLFLLQIQVEIVKGVLVVVGIQCASCTATCQGAVYLSKTGVGAGAQGLGVEMALSSF